MCNDVQLVYWNISLGCSCYDNLIEFVLGRAEIIQMGITAVCKVRLLSDARITRLFFFVMTVHTKAKLDHVWE